MEPDSRIADTVKKWGLEHLLLLTRQGTKEVCAGKSGLYGPVIPKRNADVGSVADDRKRRDWKMYIETPRLIIRNFTPEDAADLYEILGDEMVMANCEPAYDFEKTARFLADFCIGRGGAVAVVHRESAKVVGYVLFHAQEEGVYEIGWFFNRNHWRKGFAFESCKAVIDYAFSEMGVHKIFAETIDSVKSVGLMKKLGLQPEGIQRSQTRDSYGNWADLYFYGMLEEEWRGRNGSSG